MEYLTTEQIKELCWLQHKLVVYGVMLKRMKFAYTQDEINEMFDDIRFRSQAEKCQDDLEALVEKYGEEKVKNTFTNKELLSSPENRFTFEEQRRCTKEAIGEELTLEEFIEKYGEV